MCALRGPYSILWTRISIQSSNGSFVVVGAVTFSENLNAWRFTRGMPVKLSLPIYSRLYVAFPWYPLYRKVISEGVFRWTSDWISVTETANIHLLLHFETYCLAVQSKLVTSLPL
jgi:hypothetical protein